MNTIFFINIMLMVICYLVANYYYLNLSKKIVSLKVSSEYKLHKSKICNNGGIIFSSIFIIFFSLLYLSNNLNINWYNEVPRPYSLFLVFIIFFLTAVYDQFRGLHPVYRLIIQITLIFIALSTINFPLTNFIPTKIEYLLVLYFWVYIINCTNFIDGTDGMMSATNLNLYLNIILFTYLTNNFTVAYDIALLLTPLTLTFLIFFNFPKAKMFIGDTGSVPMGYINGFLIFTLIAKGEYFFAFAVFSYPFFDVTITLLKKTINGHLPWARLYDYYFLKPVIHGGKSHLYVLNFTILNTFISLISTFIVYSFNNKLFFLITIVSSLCLVLFFGKKK
jgi:UDP-N-acetylmuramyl pentapeptide phosphotransferase/UDP-N-acetylglucosamine-1-phosphate transferase